MNDPNQSRSKPIQALEQVGLHDHLCLIYETREEQLTAALAFIRIGLERGEQCLYIVDENTASTVMETLQRGGINVGSAIQSGLLVIVSKQESCLKEGHFDPDWMVRFAEEAAASARAAGFPALRGTAEMTWALGGDPGVERLMEYEAKINRFFREQDALAICQYNRNRFTPEVIRDVIRTHPKVVCGGIVCKNHYYIPPDEFLGKDQDASEVNRLLNNIFLTERNMMALQESRDELGRINRQLKQEIAERKQAEKALRKAHQELETKVAERTKGFAEANLHLQELDHLKSDLIATVSHELRTPLTALIGFSDLMVSNDLSEEKRAAFTKTIHLESKRLMALINDFLDMQRFESGQYHYRMTAVSLVEAIESVESVFQGQLGNHTLVREVPLSLPLVRADRDRLQQVLSNLLSNAIKFSPEGGEIKMAALFNEEKQEVRVSVRDAGLGIAEEDQEKIFQKFYRVYSSKQREIGGTGLGLALCKEIIEAHRGQIWFESEPGKGSTFYFTLPSFRGKKKRFE